MMRDPGNSRVIGAALLLARLFTVGALLIAGVIAGVFARTVFAVEYPE